MSLTFGKAQDQLQPKADENHVIPQLTAKAMNQPRRVVNLLLLLQKNPSAHREEQWFWLPFPQ